MDILRCGTGAALVELVDRDQVLAMRAALRSSLTEGVHELVPAARTLLVHFDPNRISFTRLSATIAALPLVDIAADAPAQVVVPVRYNGVDLSEVADATGLTRAQVVERHVAAQYTVAFCGFAPGFAYITGLDPILRLPRRATPRTTVPAGSVALADEFTGIYPRPSPGGWRLIGTTDLTVWDLDRNPPTVLAPGSPVRFEVAS